jgi:hypothetical protein
MPRLRLRSDASPSKPSAGAGLPAASTVAEAMARTRWTWRQTTTTGLLLAVATPPLIVSDSHLLLAFACANSVVLAASATVTFFARDALRAEIIREIARGADERGIPEFDRTCAQLRSSRYRRGVARTLERYAEAPTAAERRMAFVQLPGRPSAAARAAMVELGALLRREPAPPARAVAVCTLLVTEGAGSPLFSGDDVALQHTLRRVRFETLSVGPDAADPQR